MPIIFIAFDMNILYYHHVGSDCFFNHPTLFDTLPGSGNKTNEA